MKVTVTTLGDEIFSLDVSEDLELENFKAFCEVESGIPSSATLIVWNGMPLTDNRKSLKEYGLKDGDVVIMQHTQQHSQRFDLGLGTPLVSRPTSDHGLPAIDFSNIHVPGPSSSEKRSSRGSQQEEDPRFIWDTILSDPHQLALLRQNNPSLAEAITNRDFDKFSKMLKEIKKKRDERENQRLKLLKADPFDLEAQRLIAEEIRQKNVDANMEAAMEYNPEIFGTVLMLYINCKVNGRPVKAFIDSGAQTTIMSTECAERCGIMRLVDTRFSGIAKGVGVQKIIGRVHMVQLEIEGSFLTTSFSILEDQKMDMLLGLDMLKRHQCTIDLKQNVLVIGTTGTETSFLNEAELPDCARLTSREADHEDQIARLGGEEASLAKAIEESIKDNTKQSSNPAGQQFSESIIEKMMKMGFTRQRVIEELINFNGNELQATAALFAKSFKM